MTGSRGDFAGMAVVAGLAGAFGVLLLHAAAVLTRVITADEISASGTVQAILSVIALVFLGIALYVGAVVVTNTMSVVVAGRTARLSMLRLLGASSTSLRRSLVRQCALAAVIGLLAGGAVGYALTVGLAAAAVSAGWLPTVDYVTPDLVLAVPLMLTGVVVLVAAWVGTRTVLSVSPVASLSAGRDGGPEPAGVSRSRRRGAWMLIVLGLGVLGLGTLAGVATPAGSLVAMVGAFVSYGGLLMAGRDIFPKVAYSVARMLGRSAGARLAAAQIKERPAFAAGTVAGLATGVAVVTTFAVGAQTYVTRVVEPLTTSDASGILSVLWVTVGIVLLMAGFSVILAGVGLVNDTVLGAVQRRHELGLLRVLGLGADQVRVMLFVESVAAAVSATVIGVIVGTLFGWAGAQSLMGSVAHGVLAPAVPLWLPFAIVGVVALLAVTATAATVRRTLATTPLAAASV